MQYYIRQKVFSLNDKFEVLDSDCRCRFRAFGEVLSIGKRIHLKNADGKEVSYMHQKMMSLLPTYFVSIDGVDVAHVEKQVKLFHPEYKVIGPDWYVRGDFSGHEYTIEDSMGGIVATVSKKWFRWGDTYEIDIPRKQDEILALNVVFIIDAVLQRTYAAASAE